MERHLREAGRESATALLRSTLISLWARVPLRCHEPFTPNPQLTRTIQALVVKATSAADVSAAILFANAHSLPFTASGGGHSTSGTSSTTGLQIDLSHLSSVTVDAEAQTVTFGGGARWSAVDAALAEHGLATVGGTVSHTGVGGLVLGGGFGLLTGQRGLAVDAMLSVEVVLADGSVTTASESQNADLFWALRGAGASFGVVTYFTSRAFPQGNDVFSGPLIFPLEKLEAVVGYANDVFLPQTDGRQFVLLALVHSPPPDRNPVLLAVVFHDGPAAEARSGIFAPLLALGPLADMTAEMPYPSANALSDEVFTPGRRWLFGGAVARGPLDPAAVRAAADKFFAHVAEETARGNDMRGSAVAWELLSLKTVAAVGVEETAYSNRFGNCYNVATIQNWTDPAADGAVREWNRSLARFITETGGRGADGVAGAGVYNNYVSGSISAEEAFGANAKRLSELKARYDPENRFDKPWKFGSRA